MTRIRVERRLSAPGEILVQTGERVEALQKIARTTARGEIGVVDVARILGLEAPDLSGVMLKKRGDQVEAGEALAARRGALPFLHKPCRSLASGRLAAIGHGWVVVEAEAEPVDLLAFIPGWVVAITGDRNVTIETMGAHVVGACGIGGEKVGILRVPIDGPTDVLAPDDVGLGLNNAVLVGGASVSPETLDRAREMRVSGIIVGSISASFHDLTPLPPFPIVATEGYGDIPMSSAVFEVLKQLEGREVSISGRMNGPWDSTRPVVIVSLAEPSQDADQNLAGELALHKGNAPGGPVQVGSRVRGVRQPLLGQVGEIVALQAESQRVPSGLSLVGTHVAFSSTSYSPAGTTQFVPWLNLEQIADD
jgi:hypothetical protein